MPSNYPASIDSYTTKLDGVSDVLAADTNNLQDAVVAIQHRVGTTSNPTFVPRIGDFFINAEGKVYTANYGWLHDKFAPKNEAIRTFGAGQAHYEQGGNVPGIRRLCTRTDGSQFWITESLSSNCNCNCNCNCGNG